MISRCPAKKPESACAHPLAARVCMLAFAALLGWGSGAAAQTDIASAAIGKTVYLQANMRHDAQNKTTSLNPQAGEMLTLGTRVEIRSVDENRIVFSAEGRDEFVFERDRYGMALSIDDYFQHYFTDRDPLAPDAPIHRLSRMEQRNIADGALAIGMSREATFMAAGLPPPHRTASLQETIWLYWRSRMRSFRVTFDEDGRISELRGY